MQRRFSLLHFLSKSISGQLNIIGRVHSSLVYLFTEQLCLESIFNK
jgi:hypothetical protein